MRTCMAQLSELSWYVLAYLLTRLTMIYSVVIVKLVGSQGEENSDCLNFSLYSNKLVIVT